MKVPAPIRREIQRAINLIHREDKYESGMELLHRLAAGQRLKKKTTKKP